MKKSTLLYILYIAVLFALLAAVLFYAAVGVQAASDGWRATCRHAPAVMLDGETWRVSCNSGEIRSAYPARATWDASQPPPARTTVEPQPYPAPIETQPNPYP